MIKNRVIAGWILGAVSAFSAILSAVWLISNYVDAKLVHASWSLNRDGWVFAPVAFLLVCLSGAWIRWARGHSDWIWIVIGGGTLLTVSARLKGLI